MSRNLAGVRGVELERRVLVRGTGKNDVDVGARPCKIQLLAVGISFLSSLLVDLRFLMVLE
jgi:hypothetical protein